MIRTLSSICFFLLLFVLAGCGENGEKKSRELLPRATLIPRELLVVMDSAQWKGMLGEAVRDVFTDPIPGLPQAESQFTVRYLQPQDLKGFHKRYPNILFAFTLDNQGRSSKLLQSMFSENALEQIRQDPQKYMLTRQDQFAKGQEVMFLFGETEDQLVNRIYAQKQQLINYFEDIERQRYLKEYANIKASEPLRKALSERYGFTFNFPPGYEIAKQDSNFVWIRQLDTEIDKSIWATWVPYTDKAMLERDNILALRNSVAKNYIWGSDASTFMRLETEIPVVMEEVNFNGEYGVELRGLWRLEKMMMGGPFVGYAFVDEATNRLYYIEGFTYAPGQDKREVVSELDAILRSFKSTAQPAQ